MIKINWYNCTQHNIDQDTLKQKISSILKRYEVDDVQLDVSIVNQEKIVKLNKKYMDREGATDVLSFPHHTAENRRDVPLPDEELDHLGEIVVCYQTAQKEAKDSGKSVRDQLSFYIEHGLLHLLGYHHH